MKRSVLLLLAGWIFSIFQNFLHGAITIETLQGHEIAPHTKEIVQLCDKIYREYPYLYNGDDAGYESYLESYAQTSESLICLVFDGEKAIGIAAGIPMSQTRNLYQEMLQQDYDINTLFYLGEFGLKSEYQKQGIEEIMYQNIENFANKSNYDTICFWELDRPLNHRKQQLGYLFESSFWEKLGFTHHPELNFLIFWTNINETEESPHSATYWMKNI